MTWSGQENCLNLSVWKKYSWSSLMLFPVKRGQLLTQWLRLIWSDTNVTMKTQVESVSSLKNSWADASCLLTKIQQALKQFFTIQWTSGLLQQSFTHLHDRLELPGSWVYVLSSTKRKMSLANEDRGHDISCLAYLADSGFLSTYFWVNPFQLAFQNE